MKDKFSIFSPTYSRGGQGEAGINFKKSPNKFAVYEPNGKGRGEGKGNSYQSLSSTNLDHLRKIPSENAQLRQTLNFKTADFDSWMRDEPKEKPQKTNHFLRSTISARAGHIPRFRTEHDNSDDLSYSSPPPPEDSLAPRQESSILGYSRRGGGNYVGESKSWHTLYNPKMEETRFRASKV